MVLDDLGNGGTGRVLVIGVGAGGLAGVHLSVRRAMLISLTPQPSWQGRGSLMATLGRQLMQKAWGFGDAAGEQGKYEIKMICDHLADTSDAIEKSFFYAPASDLNDALGRFHKRLTEVAKVDAANFGVDEADVTELVDAIEDWATSVS